MGASWQGASQRGFIFFNISMTFRLRLIRLASISVDATVPRDASNAKNSRVVRRIAHYPALISDKLPVVLPAALPRICKNALYNRANSPEDAGARLNVLSHRR